MENSYERILKILYVVDEQKIITPTRFFSKKDEHPNEVTTLVETILNTKTTNILKENKFSDVSLNDLIGES